MKNTEDYVNFARKHNCGTIVERYLEDKQYQLRMHEQGQTRSEMEEFIDRTANAKHDHVAPSTERLTTVTHTMSYNPTKEESP